MDRRLPARHGDDLVRMPSFSNGVASALLVRQDTTPGSAVAARFLAAIALVVAVVCPAIVAIARIVGAVAGT